MKHSDIPILNDSEWKALPYKKLIQEATKFYRTSIQGKTVVNKHTGVTISFSRVGIDHTVYARKIGYEKIVAIKALLSLFRVAKYLGWGKPKPTHPSDTIGFMRFTAYLKVNGVKRRYTMDVRVSKYWKFYYDLNVYVKK